MAKNGSQVQKGRKVGKAKLPRLQVRLTGNQLGIPLQSTITFTLHIQDRVAAEI